MSPGALAERINIILSTQGGEWLMPLAFLRRHLDQDLEVGLVLATLHQPGEIEKLVVALLDRHSIYFVASAQHTIVLRRSSVPMSLYQLIQDARMNSMEVVRRACELERAWAKAGHG